ncbi:ABC transporter family protein [Streptococcus pneumoniae]|uniref:ABC transporter ATP-binding protein n=1 Tax=Bacillus sp. VMFN-A1 TaxID=2135607 RepID=UPI0005E0EB0C|nr:MULTISPECIES: ABC transporter ATP-binding protein [Bacillus]MDK4205557.1 ABC transporter ATP-binding protein [Bacillus velezensis]PWJ98028.1 ABC-2 type transport system ATP-binding protein [Bacillus sp. VMFN-A1]COD31972.1 ABC transporter family protein [Streptococcus pneumoniae]
MLQVEHISKRYGTTLALDNVALTIPKGVCYGLVGPNGSGKSTLIKIISRIIREYDGKVEFFGNENGRLGYVPQDISLEEKLTAKTNMEFFGKLHGLNGLKLKQTTKKLLEDIGLLERANDVVENFSGGMKRRLNIGCALMHDPDLIILDEPTVGVDPQSRRYIFKIVNRLKKAGKTIIYVSHYMEEIETLCDYVAFIDRGQIIDEGEINELLKRHEESSIMFNSSLSPELIKSHGFKFSVVNSGLIIKTKEPLETMERLIRVSKENNIVPHQLFLYKPKLEDVFFKLTGTDLRDEE